MPLNYNDLEKQVLERWRVSKVLDKLLARDADKLKDPKTSKFIFWEGPPTANGAPGLHHLLSRTFKDAVLRFWSLRGFAIPRQAGWDCHGLPVELQVEKELGLAGKKDIEKLKDTAEASIAYFNEECRQSVFTYLEKWEEATERMGYWIDQKHPYRTLDSSYIESVWWVLFRAWAAGYLFAKKKIVPHCPRCVSTLSSHELAQGYKENTRDPSVFVILPLLEKPTEALVVWTTTPWTLPANVAVAVNEKATYVRIKLFQPKNIVESVWVAKELIASLAKYGTEILEEKKGSEFVGLKYAPLFQNKEINSGIPYIIVSADFVSLAEGTGFVHIAPAYGEDDNILGEQLGLPAIESVTLTGEILEGLPGAGKFFKEGDKDILADLKERGLLLNETTEQIKHTYPFCWRCDTPLIYVAKDSWFLKVSEPKIKNLMIEKNKKIRWEPEHIKEGRFGEWLSGARDWAISRERYWGTPLPLWQNEAGEIRFFNISEAQVKTGENLDEIFKQGLNWLKGELKENDYHRPFIDRVVFDDFKRLPYVSDVWLDSGCMPYAQSGFVGSGEIFYPADYIAEAIDQTRGWFYTLLAVASLLEASGVKLCENEPPYKSVICLGHINDAKGQKMSKSKGNVLDPMVVMEKFGADTVRLALVSMNAAGEPKKFDEKVLETTQRNTLNLLLNMAQFYEQYTALTQLTTNNSQLTTSLMDNWMLAYSAKKYSEWFSYFSNNKLTEASRLAIDYVTEASTWYLRLSRERFKGEEKASAVFGLKEVLKTASIMLAPFCPFMTDNLWQKVGEGELFLNEKFLVREPVELLEGEVIVLAEMSLARALIEAGRALREANGLKIRQPLAEIKLWKINLSENYFKLIAAELNILKISIGESAWPKAEVAGGEIYLDITLSPELKKMGLARELKRALSDWRKQQKLKVGEVAQVLVWTDNKNTRELLLEQAKWQEIWLEIEVKKNNGEKILIAEYEIIVALK